MLVTGICKYPSPIKDEPPAISEALTCTCHMWIHILKELLWLQDTGEWTATSTPDLPYCPAPTIFPTQALGKEKNADCSNRRAITSPPYRLCIEEQRSIYQPHAGIGGWGLFFDASKQYTCLQCPCSPFAKYISHIPTAPFHTEECKERPTLPVLCTAGSGGDAR